jgi:hypothetical protein
VIATLPLCGKVTLFQNGNANERNFIMSKRKKNKLPSPSKKHENLERKGEKYSTDEIIKLIPSQITDKMNRKREMFDGDLIKFNSLRLMTFKLKGIVCSNCKIKAKYFVKEKRKCDELYHLNLYALDEDGNEILMTHDHIIPKCKNGKNHIDNTQTMCKICNELKDNKTLTKCEICGNEKKATEPFCENCTAC